MLPNLDGLTYDSSANRLYATSRSGSNIYSFDPNNLNNYSDINLTLSLAPIPGPDGITTDNAGNLFIASSNGGNGGNGYIYQINLAAPSLTQLQFVSGLDDLAPLSGPGSLAPEPSTFVLLGACGVGLAGFAWRRRKARAVAGT
jgi:hypothetical protein